MRKFRNQFFRTREEAKAFQRKEKKGAVYSFVKGSHTKKDYLTELAILCPEDPEQFKQEYPFVVAWTEFM